MDNNKFEIGSKEEDEFLSTLTHKQHSEYIKKRDGLNGNKRKKPEWLKQDTKY